jgi:hypothetical protein
MAAYCNVPSFQSLRLLCLGDHLIDFKFTLSNFRILHPLPFLSLSMMIMMMFTIFSLEFYLLSSASHTLTHSATTSATIDNGAHDTHLHTAHKVLLSLNLRAMRGTKIDFSRINKFSPHSRFHVQR